MKSKYDDKILHEETKWADHLKPTKYNRIYLFKNNITEAPKCPKCGKDACLNKTYPDKGFRIYCGSTCSRVSKTVKGDAYEKLTDKVWLEDHYVTQKMSQKNIAKLLGVSEPTIDNYLKFHNITRLDHRSKNDFGNTTLEDKDALLALYNSGKTMQQIADILGSSKATVSIYLNDYGADIREPNSYDRFPITSSKECEEMIEYIRSITDSYVRTNVRSLMKNNQEIDIVIDDLKLAIEYNGTFYHAYQPHMETEATRKGPSYHLTKTEICEKEGYQLLHIFSDQWKFRKDVVKSMLLSKIGKTERIFARQTVVKEVSAHDKDTFLMESHIQGADKSTYKFGLYVEERLVALMTFIKPRFNKKYQWELSRFANAAGVTVVGGFSKLLKHFIKNYDPENIISYADRTISQGKVYHTNGFELIGTNKPSYYYMAKGKETRIHRMHLQKKNLIEECISKGVTYLEGMTEEQLAFLLNYRKIFDCGTLTFVWSKKKTPE